MDKNNKIAMFSYILKQYGKMKDNEICDPQGPLPKKMKKKCKNCMSMILSHNHTSKCKALWKYLTLYVYTRHSVTPHPNIYLAKDLKKISNGLCCKNGDTLFTGDNTSDEDVEYGIGLQLK